MAENEIGSLDQSEETLDNLNLDEVVNEEEGPGDGGPGDGYPPVRRGGQRLVYTGGPGDKIKIPRGSGDYTNIQANTLKKLKVDGYEGVSAALDHLSRQDPFFGTGHRRSNPTPISKINKYDDQKYGYIPDVDLDDFYGKQESWYETLGKAVPKFAIKTVSKTFQGLGYLGGLLTPSNWGTPEGVVSKAADNALAKLAHNFEQKSDIEWFPSFQEAADREKGFWARATTDLDFWTDDVVDGLAFMASSWIPGMTLAKMGIGAKAMRGVGAMFKTGSRALGSTIEGAEKVSNYFKNSKKAARMLDAFSAWSLATASESMFEANDVRDKVIESLSYDSFGNPIINPDTNSPYTEDEKRKKAGEAARNTFLMNALVLGGTNVFEYRYISKMFGNAAPSVGKGIVAGELGKQATLGLAAPSALKTFGKTAALGIAREGFIEENMQLAIQRYNTKYGIAGKVGSMLDLSTYGDVLSQYAEQTKEAVSGKDNEAAMNIGIGGILGSIIPGAVAIKEEKREYANSQKILAGLNEAQDQFVKVGNIYKTEEYEQKDGNGNPFMTKRIYLDNMGRPVVDQEKLAAIAAGIQINNEMLMESEQEVNKTKQKFLRAESFGDLVSSYIKAGIENNLLENLDKIAEYNSDDIAKLGFFPDETLKDQIAAYKQLASTIIKQNEILNSDIIFDNSKIDYARKNYLTDLAAKQAVRRYVANDLTSEVENIKSELINQDNSSLSDGLVDQLNEIIYRIESQKATIAAIKEGKLERVLPLEVYESVLSELESTYEKIKEDNKTSIEQLKKDPDSVFYDYEKSQRNEFGVRDRIESRLFRRAELLNEIRNTGVLWARYADLRKGKDNYSFDFEALVEKQQEIKRTAEQEETKKREEGEKKDEEQNGFRAVEADNNSFSVVSPDGSTVVDEIETKEKAEEVAKNLNNRQKPEQEVETSVEEKKKQLRNKIDALPDNISYAVNVTTADNAKLFFDTNFPYDLESSLASKVSFFSDKQKLYDFLSSLIEQDKSAFILSFSHAEFGNVGINQIEEALVYEYEDLFLGKVPSKFTFGYFKDGVLTTKNEERPSSKSEISKTEEEKTLQEYLDEKHATLSTNPAFKIPYEEWINSPAINSHIKDYNKKYGKNEPLFGEKPPVQPTAPTPVVTPTPAAPVSDALVEEIDNLKLEETKLKDIPKVAKVIRDIFAKIINRVDSENLIDKVNKKISLIKDQVAKSYLIKMLSPDTSESEYIDQRTKGILVNNPEHKYQDKISIDKQMLNSGFKLNSDKKAEQLFGGTTASSLNESIRVIASRSYVKKSKQILEEAGIPNRTIITLETDKEIEEKLKKGQSVIALTNKMDGFHINIYSRTNDIDNVYVVGVDGYAIVNPDNSTEKVEFTEQQREFVKANMLVNGRPMTDREYNILRDYYVKMQNFQNKLAEIAPDEVDELDITDIFKETFTFSRAGIVASKGESIQNLIKNNPNKLFTVLIETEDGKLVTKNLPLLAFSRGNSWSYEFPLEKGESIVQLDSSTNEVIPVTNLNEYLKNVQNLDLFMTTAYGGKIAWITSDKSEQRGYKPYTLESMKGTEPVDLFKRFVKTFKELKESIEKGDKEKVYTFKNKQYSTRAALLKDFNRFYYGFFASKGFYVDLSYNPKTKKFLFEILPADRELSNSLTAVQKKAMHLYFKDEFTKLTDNSSEQEVTDTYNQWILDLLIDFDKLHKSLLESNDNLLKEFGEKMKDYHVMFNYEDATNKRSFYLKLQDKDLKKKNPPVSFLYYNATPSDGGKTLQLAFNETVYEKPAEKEPPAPTESSEETGGPTKLDDRGTGKKSRKIGRKINKENKDDEAYMLFNSEEDYERYTEESFKSEIKWLRQALTNSGIQLRDLGTIIDSLLSGKQVLGYYKDQAIYVNKVLSRKGVVYHEAFHALFRNILTADQRAFYIQKAKEAMGPISFEAIDAFRNERGYFNKTDNEIYDLIAEEYLADGFMKYKLEQTEPRYSWFRKFVRTIERIINFFIGNETEIESLYRDFDSGRYASNKIEAQNISDEGAFAIITGRPKLHLEIDEAGEESFTSDSTIPFNLDLQNELINKLAYLVANDAIGSFSEKFEKAVERLKADYDIESLVAQNPEMAEGIRKKYQDRYYEASFILGESVPYALSEELINQPDAVSLRTDFGDNQESLNIIKKSVLEKIKSLGLEKGLLDTDLSIPEEDDEDIEIKVKTGEFDTIHMNPLEGLSAEFRSFFSMIPYTYEDRALGVKVEKMADGKALFNATIKVAADTPVDKILPSLAKAIETLEEDNDPSTIQLVAFRDFLNREFGMDISDPDALPSKNIYLYKQFIDTFFVTELPSYQIVAETSRTSTDAKIYNATINQDINNKKEAISYYFESAYRKLTTPEQKVEFVNNFKKMQDYIKDSFLNSLDSVQMNKRSFVNKVADELKDLMDAVNIKIPKSLIRQSMLAIYTLENGNSFNRNSKENIRDMSVDQRLMKEKAYLEKEFFLSLSLIQNPENFSRIFAETKESTAKLGKDSTRVKQINTILKNSMKYIIKYDITNPIQVYQNAELKNVWRYSRYTPPILLTQLVREAGGIKPLIDLYPVLADFFLDNKLFDNSLENQLFLKNLYISANGGFRQEIDKKRADGVTFGHIDTRALLLSNIVTFMNRKTITEDIKDNKGAYKKTTITTFLRSRTQEEATTTNFFVTGKYDRYVTDQNKPNEKFIQILVDGIRQEYNRIKREWATRDDMSKVRYNLYNNILHPETGNKIEGDSYMVDGKVVNLRAYQFRMFEHFFDKQKTSLENETLRTEIKNILRDLAKSNVSFEEALKNDVISTHLKDQLSKYMDDTFSVYQNKLIDTNLVRFGNNNKMLSSLIPNVIREDADTKGKPIGDYGYSDLQNLLYDHHLNVFANKFMVNQIFDGDIATGIKSAVEHYKRNKSGVISGNSGKKGFFRTAVVENIQSLIDVNDLLKYSEDVDVNIADANSRNKVDIADGQSFHTINHRIRLLDTWGRVDPRVRYLLSKYKHTPLTDSEVQELSNKRITLNSYKTATGGILEYYKLSEHLVSRVDVSHMVVPQGMTKEDVRSILNDIYSEIELLEDQILEDPYRENAQELQEKISDLYREVHNYWTPKRSKEKLHYLLNSMEISGVDQVFDPNASKKTTIVPVKLNPLTLTDLTPSKSFTSNLFKFLQVETSGIHNTITNPTQARQILSTYIDKLDSDTVYQNMSLADLAKEYSRKLGEITSSSSIILEKTFTNPDGSVNIASLYKMMQNGLKSQGASSNDLKFFEVKNGVPVHNPNLLRIKKLFVYYYFAMFSNNVFSSKVSGRADILVSSYGQEVLYDAITGKIITTLEQDENPELYQDRSRYRTRHLGVSVEEVNGKKVYTVEVIIPKPLAKNEALKELYLKKLNVFFSTRIPTEDKRSMIVSKVVDYMDNAYQNSIVVPQLIHILAGSDLDVDKLYSHTFDYYFDYNDIPHVYGDYSEYKSPSQGRFVEYINYMQNSSLLKDAIDAEVEKVSNNPVLNNDFYKLKEELGIIETDYTFDELKNQKEELIVARDVLEKKKKEKENESNMLFESHIRLNQRYGSEGRAAWLAALSEQRVAQEEYEEKILEIEALTEEIGKMENTIRLAATLNVLTSIGMPTTQNQLTRYVSSNPNPVIPLLQNQNLSQKIAILSNEEVFSKYYINERSSTDLFKEVADSIGASVSDIVNENSIYSIMGDVIANEINSSSKDSLGISASFNKFLSFAEKNKLELPSVLLRIREKGVNYEYSDFQNDDGIRRTGESIGMFADAAKDPIPSVLNLNPVTSGVSNVINGMTGNMKFGLLINKVPFIEEITKRFQNDDSAAQEPGTFSSGSVSGALKLYISENIDILYSKGRIAELYPVDDKGNIVSKGFRKMFVEMTDANPEFVNLKKPTTTDLGFNVYYEDGTLVNEDVANIYLASIYRKVTTLNSDITKLGKILNLIKKQKPDFSELDEILSNISYFLSGDSMFGDSIVEILSKSAEYRPLMLTASMMDQYANKIFLERSPLFKSINRILNSGFNNTFGKRNARQDISDQITKFMIIQKMKAEMNYEIKNLQDKKDPTSMKKYQILKESYRYFSADTWMDPDNFIKDIDYLYDLNPGNPFVEFIKVNTRKGINFIEASTRMKMDKDITENILNGYESLQKSDDLKTLIISRQLFYYILVKDGLGYSNNTFLNYINADLVQFKQVSDSITDFQNMLSIQQNFLSSKKDEYYAIKMSGLSDEKKKQQFKKLSEEIYANYLSLFDDFFKISKKGNIDWINGMVTKIFANAANQKYIRPTPRKDLSKNKNAKEYATEFIQKGVFSNLTKLPSDKYFNFLEDAGENFTIDFSKLDTWEEEKINAVVPSSFVLIPDEAETSVKEVYFPYLLAGRDKKLYKLAFLDGNDVSKEIALASLNPNSFVTLSGLKGEYVQIKLEGTENLLSYAFTKEDGVKIFEHSEPKKEVFDPYAFFMSPSTISDNMSQEDTNKKAGVNSNMTNINGPVDESGFEFYDEDDVDAFFLNFEREKEAPVAPTAAPVSGQREFTPENLSKANMPANGIFVFGSNTEGRHGLGAAETAKKEFGAIQGQPEGLQGRSYAIITKDLSKGKRSIPLYDLEGTSIAEGVKSFIEYANAHPELKFYVTKIGSKLAGYSVEEIKGVFDSVNTLFTFLGIENYIPDNVILPKEYEVRDNIVSKQEAPKQAADIPQNKISGVESFGSLVIANDEAIKALGPNPHSIDMIEAGFRTRTTRSDSEMKNYNVKVGDVVKQFGKSADGTTKEILTRITAIHPKGSPGWKGTWAKEGWRPEDVNVIDRFKDGAAAIEFEVIKPTVAPVSGKIEFDKLPGKSATPTMTYAGIGSRQTPPEILAQMTEVARELSATYTLNTGVTFGGKKEGADKAFDDGATKKNLFSPENQGSRSREQAIAKEIHPNPEALSQGGLRLMARNTNQVFGDNLDTPVDFVLFYAKETKGIRPEGGTGQAVQMARMKGIPTINMANPNWRQELDRVLSGSTQPTQASVSKQEAPIQQPMTEEEIEKAEQDAMKASLMAAMKDSAKPQVKTYPKIESYLNGLSKENRAKLGSLKDLIAEFEAVPFTYTEEDFIEDLKCRP